MAPGTEAKISRGDRIADVVSAWGGSWSFIFVTAVFIAVWMAGNAIMAKSFDAYPFILLNLVLAVMSVLQAPFIMMSQNRQAARDRLEAQQDHEVNAKAELEIAVLSAKLDEIREGQWMELMTMQRQQLALLSDLLEKQALYIAAADTKE
jgi:uncharacterized membrane protein